MPKLPPSSLAPRRLLVRGVNWLGDAVMTTPALQRLRLRFPQAHITLLTPRKLADLWLHHPSVDEVLTFSSEEGLWSVGRRLRQGHFDAALVLPNSPRSALEVWLGRIPHRIGYARPWRNWSLTHPVPTRPGHLAMRKRSPAEIQKLIAEPTSGAPQSGRTTADAQAHHIHEYLYLAAALGADPGPVAPLLRVLEQERQAAAAAFLKDSAGSAPLLLGLNPSAAYGPAKCWPAERFAATARAVSQQSGPCLWLVFGEAKDQPLGEEIARLAGVPLLNLAGKTSLRQLMGLLQLCRVLLTNDSGPMHLAAALDTPVVVPFGSTSPELTGPGLPGDPRHHLLRAQPPCAPCFLRTCPIDRRCLTAISVDQATAAVLAAVQTDKAAI